MNQPATQDLPAKQTMTIAESLSILQKHPDLQNNEAFEVIKGAISNNVVALGEHEAFALRDSEGEIRCFKQRLTLSLKDKTLVQIPGGDIGISAQGYEQWAEGAGANCIFPDNVLVGNKWQPNPYAIEGDNGRIKRIYARAVSFKFSSKGIPQVCDWTTTFDTPSYRMIDLIAKAKRFPQAFKLLPKDMGKPNDEGTWGSYVFDETMVLWVNSAHEEALQWYGQIINREKKAMDFAQTFARRNSLKHLSGLQKAPGPVWTMTVLCWRPTSGNIVKWDATQYANLRTRVGGLIHSQGKDFKAIEMQTGSEDVGDDENGYDMIENELDPEDKVVEGQLDRSHQDDIQTDESGHHETSGSLSKEDEKAMHSISIFSDDAEYRPYFIDACKNIGVNPDAPINPDTARKIIKLIEEKIS